MHTCHHVVPGTLFSSVENMQRLKTAWISVYLDKFGAILLSVFSEFNNSLTFDQCIFFSQSYSKQNIFKENFNIIKRELSKQRLFKNKIQPGIQLITKNNSVHYCCMYMNLNNDIIFPKLNLLDY